MDSYCERLSQPHVQVVGRKFDLIMAEPLHGRILSLQADVQHMGGSRRWEFNCILQRLEEDNWEVKIQLRLQLLVLMFEERN